MTVFQTESVTQLMCQRVACVVAELRIAIIICRTGICCPEPYIASGTIRTWGIRPCSRGKPRLCKPHRRGVRAAGHKIGIGKSLYGEAVICRVSVGLLHKEQGNRALLRGNRGEAVILLATIGVRNRACGKRIGDRTVPGVAAEKPVNFLIPRQVDVLRRSNNARHEITACLYRLTVSWVGSSPHAQDTRLKIEVKSGYTVTRQPWQLASCAESKGKSLQEHILQKTRLSAPQIQDNFYNYSKNEQIYRSQKTS